jgi:hypothetical protein
MGTGWKLGVRRTSASAFPVRARSAAQIRGQPNRKQEQEWLSPVLNPKDMNPTRDDFAALLNETLSQDDAFEGSVVKGKITAIEKDLAVIDVGLKMEGRVPLREFSIPASRPS